MSKYIVKPVVCDYGIFIVDDLDNEDLVEICNSQANANTICDIFNADLMKDGAYTIWKDHQIKILEKALELACERLKNLYCSDYCGNLCDDWCVTEEDLKQECKLYYKCWNKDCILEQAKEMMKSE